MMHPNSSVAAGIKFFEQFLKSEFSEENIQFWKACKRFKEEIPTEKLQREAKDIFEKYISQSAPKLVRKRGEAGLLLLATH